MVAIFLIGILGNSLFSLFADKSNFFSISILLLVFIFVNAYFYLLISEIKKTKSTHKLKYLSIWQIGIELIIFTIIIYLGGDKGMACVFFFLPIISASIIFGIRGAVITAILAATLVNLSVTLDYFIYLWQNIFGQSEFNTLEFTQFKYKTYALISVIATSNFYLVVAIFSGYSSKLLFKREQVLIGQAENLVRIKEYRENELRQLDKTTKLLVKRDQQLTIINKELDKKIQELERSEKSMFKAFADLKKERKKLEEERNKVNAIIANFVDPIILIDNQDRLSLCNPAARELFEINNDDLGRPISHEDNYSLKNFAKIMNKEYTVKSSKEVKSGNPDEEEIIIKHNDQELTYKVITAKVTDSQGKFLGTMKIFYNMTREKMIDKLKSEFISIAAHQLRTPLSAIKWVVKMVLDGDAGKLNEEQYELLDKGYKSNERIIELVNDMLSVSRIEEGRFGYSFADCDFTKVLSIVLDSLENQIKTKKLKIKTTIPKKMPKVLMDRKKMILVLQNLLENAAKYTPEYGTIEVKVEAGKQFLQFKVKDNGVGIPSTDQAKLFTKFFRAANVMRMQSEGSGLGLFIVKNIIKRHDGEITFKSQEGKGAEFVFTLPLQ